MSVFQDFESQITERIRLISERAEDTSHDFLHFERVVKTAKNLCRQETANADIVIPAAWLHDFVIVPKNDPRRKIKVRAWIIFTD